jgi:hypothetical protein
MSKSIEFRFPAIPQSVNKLYFTKGGRRILSGQGKKFKNSFIATRGGATAATLMSFVADPDATYQLELWFFLSRARLYNLTYGTDKRVKSPFKDIDVSNMVKLAEDSVAELIGIRDRNNWTVICHKRVADDGDEGMVARLQPINLEEDPYAID